MATWRIGHVGAAAGVAFIVLNLIANLSVGSTPDFDDSPAKIASFFDDHHGAVLVHAVLTGLAAPLFRFC
jgi:hypothetical protein